MFFFIAGVQPKTVTLDEARRLCPSCGLAQARLKRVDHYLSLFFIPLFPVKRGEPVLVCDRCGAVSRPEGGLSGLRPPERGLEATPTKSGRAELSCRRCGGRLEPSFRYCPHCGERV